MESPPTKILGGTRPLRPIGIDAPGGHYISVTSGYKCVDFRKFYVPYGQSEVKPTKKGIALRLREWDEMKRIVDAINDAFPALATALPCYMLSDHLTSFDRKDCYPHL